MLQILAITGPIYLLIAAGFLTTRAGLFARADMRVFGKFVINLALPFFVGGIAWQAHAGGLLIGFLIGVILVRTRRQEQRTRQIAAVAGVAIGLLVLFGAYLLSAPAVYF